MKRQDLPWILAMALGLFAVMYMNEANQQLTKRPYQYIFPTTRIRHFTFGFNESMGDSYWVRILQDFNVCIYPKAPEDAPRTGVNRTPHCELDWVYHMLEVTTELIPRFFPAYSVGGSFLSVVVDDVKGATRILEKGVSRFPDNWYIHYQAATHYMVEDGDKLRAAYLYDQAVKMGAPSWIVPLAAKLYDESGRTELAVFNLKQFIRMYPYDKFVEQAHKRLAELEKSLTPEQIKKLDELVEKAHSRRTKSR